MRSSSKLQRLRFCYGTIVGESFYPTSPRYQARHNFLCGNDAWGLSGTCSSSRAERVEYQGLRKGKQDSHAHCFVDRDQRPRCGLPRRDRR